MVDLFGLRAQGLSVGGETLDLSYLETKTKQFCEFALHHELSWCLAYFKINFRAEVLCLEGYSTSQLKS